jgi:hypothetical protein
VLTIFTTPKPFVGHIGVIQRNAIGSWTDLGEGVEILLIGDEEGMQAVSQEFNIKHLPDVECNELGTPLVSSIFKVARETARHSTLCYVNADIIFLDDFMDAVKLVQKRFHSYLMLGQRWDLKVENPIDFGRDWKLEIREQLDLSGRFHPPAGSDYFVYKRGSFQHMPPFALGRAGWDNWMIYAGRAGKMPVVDVTHVTTVIHQEHDYAHLPDGQPHYRLPESKENVRLSGGQETIFTLSDADWTLAADRFQHKPLRERLGLRWIETSIVASFGPGLIARVFRMILHPGDSFQYYLNAIKRRFKGSSIERSDMRRDKS